MKRFTLFSIVLSFVCISNTTAQKIPYFLPKKVFEVTIPYTVITVQEVFKKDKKPKTAPKIKIIFKDEITVVGKVYAGEAKSIDLSFLGNSGRSYNLEIGYEGGNGTIATLNGSQEPVTGEIIKGTVGIVSSVLKIFSGGIFGFSGGAADGSDTEEIKTEETFEEKRFIEIKDTVQPTELSFKVGLKSTLPVGVLIESNPELKVVFTPKKIIAKSDIAKSSSSDFKSFTLPMYLPREYDLTVTVFNNSKYIADQVIIKDVVYVPQKGEIYDLAVPILKGKRKVEMAFNPVTGLLTKYNITKTSTSKDIFSDSKSSLDELSGAIKELKESQKAQKELKENKDVNDQIAQLKLENEALDLLIKKRDLESALNQKK